ncbi:MAG: nucleoid occlusion factor SlmA [Proteobacteria bacterium]|nr:nucleoid occlusion factor SlmA [Pseudomonadota bacterium]MDA1332040.1 nucleoid occlusion factor SlmA [Pseudomonadota bacterium]
MPRVANRKLQILQQLAQMLEDPNCKKITTALLASRLEVSEAALYRHFASKAQMYEGLIEFIEQTIFGLVNKISETEESGLNQVSSMVSVLLSFAKKNPGMTRVLIGDALVYENDRLQDRINRLHDRLESSIKQSLRFAINQGDLNSALEIEPKGNQIMAYVVGRWYQFAKSRYTKDPMTYSDVQIRMLLGDV